jgi:hypothetical protein
MDEDERRLAEQRRRDTGNRLLDLTQAFAEAFLNGKATIDIESTPVGWRIKLVKD